MNLTRNPKKNTKIKKRKHQEIQPNVGHQKKIDKNMRSLFKVCLNVGFCCFVCLCIFCVLFVTVCHFVCYFGVLQVHPCVHEVSLNLCIVVCCMAVAAVFFVSFEFGPSLAYALHVQCSNCPVPIFRHRGPERTSNFIEDSAQKMAAISTMGHS